MSSPLGALRYAVAAFVVSGGLIVASCSGGSIASTPVGQATNQPASTQTIPTAGGTLSIPAASTGQVAAFVLAAGAPAGVTITASSSITGPGSAPAPSSLKRSAEAISGAVPFFYVTFTVSATLSTNFLTGETVTLTSNQPATASYYAEFDDITSAPGTKLGCVGPGTVANLVATITNGNTGGACTNSGTNSPTLQTGHTYLMQVYYVAAGSATATPSAAPTATATASASASPTAFPSTAATASAAMVAAGGSLTLPAFLGFSGSLTYGAMTGAATLPVALTYSNYIFALGLPNTTPMPTILYAVVNVQNTSASSNVSFGTAQTMTLTIPTLVGASSAVVRYWEWQGSNPSSALCVTTSGTTALTVTPVNGVITIPSPLGPNIAACTSPPAGVEQSIAPFFPMDNAIIEVTNT